MNDEISYFPKKLLELQKIIDELEEYPSLQPLLASLKDDLVKLNEICESALVWFFKASPDALKNFDQCAVQSQMQIITGEPEKISFPSGLDSQKNLVVARKILTGIRSKLLDDDPII